MPKDINLLPQVLEAEMKRTEYRRYGSLLSFGLIGAVLVILVGLFIWSFIIDGSLTKVKQDISNRETGIRDNADKELKLRALSSKLKLVKPLVDTSFGYSDIVTKVQEVARLTPALDMVELILEGTQVTLSARAPSSAMVQEYLNNLTDSDIGGNNFGKVVLSSLSRNDSLPEYRFSLKMVYKPETNTNASN